MSNHAKTLNDFTLPQMNLICTSCPRRGRYDLQRLKKRFGENAPIHDVIEAIVGECREKMHGRCGAGCDDLVWMFSPIPFSDAWAKRET